MNKHTMMVVGVTAVLTLILAPKLRQLPLVSKLPTL
jgi:hypothetical protein